MKTNTRGALILYGSSKKLTKGHYPVHHHAPHCKGPYYVRIEFIPNVDCESALSKVKLQKGETLLNTVDYEQENMNENY